MALATFWRRKSSRALSRIGLREDVFRGLGKAPLRVDREKGILYETKILGWTSENNRGYDPDGTCQCKSLYEKAPSDVDHTTKGNPNPKERVGWHENIQCKEDGLYSDFHFLNPKTEFAVSVMNAAEQNPGLFGFSHDADGEPDPRNPNLIRRIVEVRSVDIVTKPATTKGLFESRSAKVKITVKKLLESQRKRFSKLRLGWMDRLIEDMTPPMDAEVEPAADADPEDALADGFEASALAVVRAAIAGEMDTKEALTKLEQLLTTHDSLSSSDEPAPVEEDDETDDDKKKKTEDDDDKDKEKTQESILESVLSLCDDMDYTPSGPVRRALVALKTKADRKALIEESKKAAGEPAPRRGPRSSGQSTATKALQESEVPKENKDIATWLRG